MSVSSVSYGFVSFALRSVEEEHGLEFGDYFFPKGTGVLIPIRWLHLEEGGWTDPLEFRPSRFDRSPSKNKEDRGSIGRYNYIPFASGAHKCIGKSLAMSLLRTCAALLLRDWEFDLDENKLEEEGTMYHLSCADGIPHFNIFLKLKHSERKYL